MVLQQNINLMMRITRLSTFQEVWILNEGLRTVILWKAPYPTFNMFFKVLTGFHMRKEKHELPQKSYSISFSTKRSRGKGLE